jgi:hypothetical protein
MNNLPDEGTDEPLIADHRNYYKVEKWTKAGQGKLTDAAPIGALAFRRKASRESITERANTPRPQRRGSLTEKSFS